MRRSGISGQRGVGGRGKMGCCLSELVSVRQTLTGGVGAGGGRRSDSKKSEVWACLCWQRSQVWTDQKEMTTGHFWNRFFNFPPFLP